MRMKYILFFLISLNTFAFEFEVEVSNNLKGELRNNALKAIELVKATLQKDSYWEKVYAIESFTCLEEDTPSIDQIREMRVSFKLKKYFHISKTVKAKTEGQTVSLNWRAGARTPKALTNTIFHEALHVAGISHCYQNDISKHPHIADSIPYVLGRLLEEDLNK